MIGLVGCGKTKLAHPAPAAELYTGNLFTACRRWAMRRCSRWFILSAKHGLIEPTRIVAPYDTTLASIGSAGRDAWARSVGAQIDALGAGDTFVLLAGELYGAFRPYALATVEDPMRGLGLGRRLAWLKAQREAA